MNTSIYINENLSQWFGNTCDFIRLSNAKKSPRRAESKLYKMKIILHIKFRSFNPCIESSIRCIPFCDMNSFSLWVWP